MTTDNPNKFNMYEARPRYDEGEGKHYWDVYCNDTLQCSCDHWERAENIIVALQEDDEYHGQNQDVEA